MADLTSGSSSATRLLLIDDEAPTLLPLLAEDLEPLGFGVTGETDPQKAVAAVERHAPDAVLLDLHFPGDVRIGSTTGSRLAADIRRRFPAVPVVVFTVRLSDFDIPLETLDERPHGYFAKPDFDPEGEWAGELARTVRAAIAAARQDDAPDVGELGFPVGRTREMREAAAAIRGAAGHALPMLIFGESGTGKRAAAEVVHGLSGRAGRFESYRCYGVGASGAFETLFGREGDESVIAGPGLIELADGGSLFLDGIDHLPTELWERVQRAIEESALRRMGGTSDKRVDVRWIAATNHSLDDLVADNALSLELAYVFARSAPVSLPPLRRRMCDLPELYAFILERANEQNGWAISTALRPETRQKLEAHPWPGNIRELEAVLLRAVVTANSNMLLPSDIDFPGFVAPGSAGGTAIEKTDTPEAPQTGRAVVALADDLESLPISERYPFLISHGGALRREILVELIRRLRKRSGRRIPHKTLAAALDPLDNPERDLNRIRQLLHGSGIRLTQLEVNQ